MSEQSEMVPDDQKEKSESGDQENPKPDIPVEESSSEISPEETAGVSTDDTVDGDQTAGQEEEIDPIAALQAEVEHWKDMALRQKADLENFRKRTTRDRQEAIKYANSNLLEALLPILDNFEMGLNAARAESEESMIFRGMDMVGNQLKGFLEELGVTEIEAEGKQFDPNSHEAVSQEASDTVPEGGIIRVIRRGFRLRERLLRAPSVVVSTGPASQETDQNEGESSET